MPVEGSESSQILIVDASEDARTTLRAALELAGYGVVEADGGLEALSLVARRRFDAVIMDLVLPDIDGCELAERLRSESGSNMAVVVFTAKAPLGTAVPAAALVRKPGPLGELLAVLHALTRSRG